MVMFWVRESALFVKGSDFCFEPRLRKHNRGKKEVEQICKSKEKHIFLPELVTTISVVSLRFFDERSSKRVKPRAGIHIHSGYILLDVRNQILNR
jgi:hypothetical protein